MERDADGRVIEPLRELALRERVIPPYRKPRLLDLFCGAGGAAKGYHDAGWDIVGIDLNPQPNYPYEFYREDAVSSLRWLLLHDPEVPDYDAIHASPPCQRKSRMTNCRPGLAETYPDLIGPVRDLLVQTGKPWVIENVEGSDLRDPVWLCGFMFGRELYRHRGFETNWPLPQPEHPEHTIPASKAGHWRPGTVMSVAGHVAPVAKAREVMEIDWTTREELAEAIPPYYAQYVGLSLRKHIKMQAIHRRLSLQSVDVIRSFAPGAESVVEAVSSDAEPAA